MYSIRIFRELLKLFGALHSPLIMSLKSTEVYCRTNQNGCIIVSGAELYFKRGGGK